MQEDIALQYNAYTTKKGNNVWCGTMALAWQNLAKTFHLKEIKFQTEQPSALKIIHNFNHSRFTEKDVEAKSIYVATGKGPKTQDLINKQMEIKFPKCTFPKLDYKLGETDIISFAYLFKQLKFNHQFIKRKEPTFLFNGKAVPSFYAKQQCQKDQIRVCYYKSKENFCIYIADKFEKETLFLLKTQKFMTVDEVIKEVDGLSRKGGYPQLDQRDSFEMPIIQIDCQRSVEELIGLYFANHQLSSYMVGVMIEALKLKVDETGAKVESRAVIMALQCARMHKQPPKQCILDKTFWIVMKQVGKHPYLCMQVVDPSDI